MKDYRTKHFKFNTLFRRCEPPTAPKQTHSSSIRFQPMKGTKQSEALFHDADSPRSLRAARIRKLRNGADHAANH
jgi:hypothetical protein